MFHFVMHFKKFLFFLSVSFIAFNSFTQDDEADIINELIEEISIRYEDETDIDLINEELNYLVQNPININYATKEELGKLNLFTGFQITSLISYREKNGLFLSVWELSLVYGFSENLVKKIAPFISTEKVKKEEFTLKNGLFPKGRQEILFRTQRVIEKQDGYNIADSNKTKNNYYLGSPQKYYFKYQYRYSDHIRAGLTTEKDAGEEFFTGSNPLGFDLYSGFYEIKKIKRIHHIIIGDYYFNCGQGLVLWPGYSIGKSSFVLNIANNNKGLSPKTSANENLFLRGLAGTFKNRSFLYTVYLSSKNIDANVISTDSLSGITSTFSSFQLSGLHNTNGTVEDEKAVKEWIYGSCIEWKYGDIRTGLNFTSINYNSQYIPQEVPYNKYKILAKGNYYTNIYYDVYLKNSQFFGEFASQFFYGISLINGVVFKASPRAELSVLYRCYSKNYFSPYSNAFGESTVNNDEHGIYTGCNIYLFKDWKLTAYSDFFKNKWLKYQVNAPADGTDYLAELNYSPSENLEMYLRYHIESNPKSGIDSINSLNISNNIKRNIRYHINYKISDNLFLKNRIELLYYQFGNNPVEKGFLFYQDIVYKPAGKVSSTLRYVIFDTDSYQSGIYAYENDVLYASSVPSYFYRGMRYYLIINFQVNKKLKAWFYFSQTQYSNRECVGSGLNRIEGERKSEIKLQVQYKF